MFLQGLLSRGNAGYLVVFQWEFDDKGCTLAILVLGVNPAALFGDNDIADTQT
jgi:hypothetical protein